MVPIKRTISLIGNEGGSLAIQFAVILPVLLILFGSGLDYALAMAQRQSLQAAADSAALRAATELGFADAKRENVASAVEEMVSTSMKAEVESHNSAPRFETIVREEPFEVEVIARQKTNPVFGGSFGLAPGEVTVNAVARIVGRPNICVLALEKSEPNAVWMIKDSQLTGNNCAVYSNSLSSHGLAVNDGAIMTANTICSAGGVDKTGSITPAPVMDCPQFEDPLASRAEPAIGSCDYNGMTLKDQTVTLKPGVYCGGLKISGTSKVKLEPGVYIIADGALWLDGNADLSGDDISFFLGEKAFLFFGPSTSIELSASTTGPLAGLLLFGSRKQSKIMTHTILSRSAQHLVGTIYLPQNSFVVDGDAAVGGESAYTAIVARRLVLLNGPNLVLNSNYGLTDVPVPDGIRGAAQPIALVK
ncbi:MAG: TadE family protein [Hyphomicrobium sp.]